LYSSKYKKQTRIFIYFKGLKNSSSISNLYILYSLKVCQLRITFESIEPDRKV